MLLLQAWKTPCIPIVKRPPCTTLFMSSGTLYYTCKARANMKATPFHVSAPREHRPKSSNELDERVLERSDWVLWTLAPNGIVLHNLQRRYFLELDNLGYSVWGFLDGARTVEEVINRCCSVQDNGELQPSCELHIRNMISTMAQYGFIEERNR
ncbi:PqqD family protein [Hymenobacter perfusus]|uniref:PqqD family protein n=1 Tax=Hymenobacter perfusus TaxID=1236770 RepID=A0A3R9URZ3_9BACT|nr:PqqD family protein [Hymenobacter perfusus]